MKRTRACALLLIKHPIIQGSMLWLSTDERAAAVSKIQKLVEGFQEIVKKIA